MSTGIGCGIGSTGLPLYLKEQLQHSPSVKDGLDPHKEVQWRRQYTHFIIDVGKNLEVPQWAIYTAVFLCHHYFVKRSMLRNDRYLIATACLYLACKVQESPKYLRDVIKQAEIKKWSKWHREHPTEQKRWEDNSHLEVMRDQVLVAERAVLYTISFQLRIKVPYPDLLMMQEYVSKEHKHDLINIAWNLVNDSLQTTLSLVYPPEKLAASSLFLAHEMHGLPLPSRDGRGFCELANITADELQDISDQLLSVYITVVHKDSTPGTPGHADPTAPGQPTSPDANSHLQLQENRVRLVMQRQQPHPLQQHRPHTPAAPLQEQQEQQEVQQQPPQSNGSLQQHRESGGG